MKEFMLIFRFTPNQDFQPSQEEEQAQHQAWGSWIGGLASQEKFVSTSQLDLKGKVLQADHTLSNGIYQADETVIGGNLTLKSKSIAEAAELSKGCPILQMGGSVEIREVLPMQ